MKGEQEAAAPSVPRGPRAAPGQSDLLRSAPLPLPMCTRVQKAALETGAFKCQETTASVLPMLYQEIQLY